MQYFDYFLEFLDQCHFPGYAQELLDNDPDTLKWEWENFLESLA